MESPRVLIVSVSSDLGSYLAEHFLKAGSQVLGTYRTSSPNLERLKRLGLRLSPLDIACPRQVHEFAKQTRDDGFRWNVLISAAGILQPIGKFFAKDFDEWERSVTVNSLSQLRVLHALYEGRDYSTTAKVIFFAGGGTNGPFDNYSAYCIGKHVLLKMTELLDSEYPELQVSIIGTGWVNTKIHRQTIAAGHAAGANLGRTQEFLTNPERGSSLERVAACIDWCLASSRLAVGGRNFSVVHDPWTDEALISELERDTERYKMRRRS